MATRRDASESGNNFNCTASPFTSAWLSQVLPLLSGGKLFKEPAEADIAVPSALIRILRTVLSAFLSNSIIPRGQTGTWISATVVGEEDHSNAVLNLGTKLDRHTFLKGGADFWISPKSPVVLRMWLGLTYDESSTRRLSRSLVQSRLHLSKEILPPFLYSSPPHDLYDHTTMSRSSRYSSRAPQLPSSPPVITLYDTPGHTPQPWAPNIWRIRYVAFAIVSSRAHTWHDLIPDSF